MSVKIRSYLSQTLVLLALDWPDAPQHPDFLGFAIKRTPGFRDDRNGLRAGSSWLPNRLSFGAATHVAQTRSVNTDTPSNIAPIQKFSWWDARFDDADREHTFRYDVYPVTGTPDTLTVRTSDRATCSVTLPSHTVDGIGTWFNRAVVFLRARPPTRRIRWHCAAGSRMAWNTYSIPFCQAQAAPSGRSIT